MSNTTSLARIVIATTGGVQHVGMAALIDEQHVITCCHVINDALPPRGRLERMPPPAETILLVKFLYPVGTAFETSAKIVKWGLEQSLDSDIAVLQLAEPAPVEPAVFWEGAAGEDKVNDKEWSCIGYNASGEARETEGKCQSVLPNGKRQLNGSPVARAPFIKGGYSGSPVWCEELKAFIGIVVTIDANQIESGVSFALPTEAILNIWPSLHQRQANGNVVVRKGAEPEREAHLLAEDLFVLDRTDLTKSLMRLRGQQTQKRVILVRGGPNSGKSHCRHLFRSVAREDQSSHFVYLDRDLMGTVDETIAKLFSALQEFDKTPLRATTTEAWYGTVFLLLHDIAAKGRKTLWIAVDDLGFDPNGDPLIDPEICKFFNQFVLQMKNPAFSDTFRLMLIHYPNENVPNKWDREILLKQRVCEEDVQHKHVVAAIRCWLENQRRKMTDTEINVRAEVLLARASAPLQPGGETASRLQRIHDELIIELESIGAEG